MTDRIIESERLYLKQFTQNDVNDFFLLNSDADVMKFIRPPETDVNVIRENIDKIRKYYKDNPSLDIWASFEKKSDEFIGFFELAHMDNTEEIEVGYRLHKKYWGKGYATEMTKVLIDYGFNELNLEEIVGITHPDNFASQKVLQKAGLEFIKEAFFYEIDVKYFRIKQAIQ